MVDAGGDVALRGEHEVHVEHPLRPQPAARLRAGGHGDRDLERRAPRLARRRRHAAPTTCSTPRPAAPRGPASLAATALAPTALEAETLAKVALLTGSGAVLAERGGLTVDAAGGVDDPRSARHDRGPGPDGVRLVARVARGRRRRAAPASRSRWGSGSRWRAGSRRRARRALLDLHQHTALAGLVAIAVHGITLMGDQFLHPEPAQIAVPFLIEHARVWTGLGVTAGWLAAILGLSYWLRDRIGPRRWRSLHRATLLVYVLAVAHTLGSGSDAGALWLQALLLATGAPILFLFLLRVLPAPRSRTAFRRMRVTAVVPESARRDLVRARAAPIASRSRRTRPGSS